MTAYAWVTLTLRRNRQGARSNCLSFGGSYPRLQPGGRSSRVSCSVCEERPKTSARPNRRWGLSLVFSCPFVSFRLSKRNLGTLVKRQFMLSGVFRLFFKCHLSCFADRFTEKHVRQPLLGFIAVASWRRRGSNTGK